MARYAVGMPNDPDQPLDDKTARRRKPRMLVGIIVLVGAVPPSINALSNPRIATLHATDVMGLLAAGLCFGFGSALLISNLISQGE
jgi:hypothetical protein